MKRERVVLMGDRRRGGERVYGWDARNPHHPTYYTRKQKRR